MQPKNLYLKFSDYNGSALSRNLNIESISRAYPILKRSSDYHVCVSAFSLPTSGLGVTNIARFDIKSNTLPIQTQLINGRQEVTERILFSYYPTAVELGTNAVVFNSTNNFFSDLDSNEPLRETDLFIDVVYVDGSKMPFALGTITGAFVDLYFERITHGFSLL